MGALAGAALSFVLWGAGALGQAASDGAAAEKLLADLSNLPQEQAQLVHDPIDQAKRALERARGARQSGDLAHAAELEGVAREWAETARDLLRATRAEADAGATQATLRTAMTQSERNRALVEETIARKMRAAAELEKLETARSSDEGDAKAATPGATPAAAKTPRISSSGKPIAGKGRPPRHTAHEGSGSGKAVHSVGPNQASGAGKAAR